VYGDLFLQDMVVLSLELCKVFLRLDQPTAALQQYAAASERHPGDIALLLGAARVHDALDQTEEALAIYHQVCWDGFGAE
jgi:tetratricopeptide repeat protein 8